VSVREMSQHGRFRHWNRVILSYLNVIARNDRIMSGHPRGRTMQITANVRFFHPCSKCGSRAHLFRISPLDNGNNARSYECRRCGQIDCYEVATDPARFWMPIETVVSGLGRTSQTA